MMGWEGFFSPLHLLRPQAMYSFGVSKFSKAFRLLTWPNKHVTILPGMQSSLQKKQKPNFGSCFDYKNQKKFAIQGTHTEVCQVCLDPHVLKNIYMYPISNFDLHSTYRWTGNLLVSILEILRTLKL